MDFPSDKGYPILRTQLSTMSPSCLCSVVGVVQGNGANGTFAWGTANLALFYPVVLNDWLTFNRMVVLNGATLGGNLDVGIYDVEGNKIVSSGSIAQAGVSVPQVLTIATTTLGPGVYFLAMSTNSTTATYTRLFGAAQGYRACGAAQMATAFALPQTATFAAMAGGNMPVITAATKTVV